MAAAPSRARLLLLCCCVAAALLAGVAAAGGKHGHGKPRHAHMRRLRPGKGGAAGAAAAPAKPYPVNATRVEAIERQFTRWVRFMGAPGHSSYNPALNRALLPTRTLVVDRTPGAGDFTSIQAAVTRGWLLFCDNMQGCHVHAIARNYGALTAQNRQSLLEDTGFSFVNCRVTGSGALYLGRAWGTFSRVVFAYTYMDNNIIIPRGWYNWGDPTREMSVPACLLLLLSSSSGWTVFYGQYKCTGPGANYAGRVQWSRELTDEEAKPFISLDFIDGLQWLRL
ncbi:putative pectinesterase 53 [Panicum miliaceum]|uniref:pectinesterase n=1 Tax=Panicum miliaceum TaxID=4540 RepID=A0A3L6T0C9_PANMI|nr:putative pectinesterase 53 [Panicum miliaceum]